MNLLEALFLGILQGITEFLPISSSGHLVIAQHIMGIQTPGVLLETILHMGTLVSIIIYYSDDIFFLMRSTNNNYKESKYYFLLLFIATIPAVIFGSLFKEIIENTFSIQYVKWFLIITGITIGSTYFYKTNNKNDINYKNAIIIGLSQVVALFPGVSRSGMTLSTALILGIDHSKATKFIFFMAIPILLGAGMLQIISMDLDENILLAPLFIGFISSLITGYLVINWLIKIISKGKFYFFSIYCFIISMIQFLIID